MRLADSYGLLHRFADKLGGRGLASIVKRSDQVAIYASDEVSGVETGMQSQSSPTSF